MSQKEFVDLKEQVKESFKLAHCIYCSGFRPKVIYVVLRGGAYLGNIVSEYYKLRSSSEHPILYAAVVARSYAYKKGGGTVEIDGWTYEPKQLSEDDRVLLIDDIFDSGKTMEHLLKILLNQGLSRENIKIAVYGYKRVTNLKPDFFVKEYDKEAWVHYLSHEVEGLTALEIDQHYPDGEVKSVLKSLINQGSCDF